MAKRVHPTCHLIPLEKASKVIAFLDMILGLVGIIWFVFMLGKYDIISLDPFENNANENNTKIDKLDQFDSNASKKLSKNHKIIGLTLSGFFTTVNLMLFAVLLIGIHKKHIGLCLTWFYIRCAVIVFKMILFLMYLIAGRPLFSQIPFIAFMLIHAYGLWVVNNYVEELRDGKFRKDLVFRDREQVGYAEKIQAQAEEDGINGIEKLAKKRQEFYHGGGGGGEGGEGGGDKEKGEH